MTEVTPAIATIAGTAGSDRPEAYLPRDRRRALALGVPIPDRVHGAALFADISGFTPLTEALARELGQQRGAEVLTATIGRVFHAVIDELDRRGGEVIYFSGDAITCWLDGDDGSRAAGAALAMHDAMGAVGRIVTPGGSAVQLGMKVALAVGAARRFVVGDPDIQRIDVLAGRLIDALAEAEHHAERGETILDETAIRSLGSRVSIGDLRIDAAGRRFGVLAELRVAMPAIEVVEPPQLPESVVREWLLPPVYERMRAGRGEFLAELRPAYPVFLRFAGIDFDDDPDAIAKLDEFVCRAQRVMAAYGGNVLQLTLGDKGAYLYGVFGSPIAHEDDAPRAAAAALELRDLEQSTAVRDIRIGITHGRLRSGTYGHAMRRTFVCLGDAVNLAARLMAGAPDGGIWVSDSVRAAAGDAFLWEPLPPLTLKGKSQPITASALTGSLERASRRRMRFELPLTGRAAEMGVLDGRLADALEGEARVVGIAAEAGMGKSRLVAEFVREARRDGRTVVYGECQAFGTTTPYAVWREIWRRLLEVDEAAPPADQAAALARTLAAIEPALAARVPLLAPVVGIEIPDTELTASFDAKLRKGSLEDLLGRCLRARAEIEPLVVVLEDCHWIDELSRDLLEVLARAAGSLPVLFMLAYRPAERPGGGLGLEGLPGFSELELTELPAEETAQLIRAKLEQLLGADAEAPQPLVRLVTERSEGNPLYVEELIDYLAGRQVDLRDAAALATVELPESLHSLVLSRIDGVPEDPRRTLKVASVIGRTFRAPALPEVYPELGDLDAVRGHLGTLGSADLVRLDRAAEEGYLFKHVVTQEVAYESMPFAVRATLHRLVGEFIERSEADAIDQHLDLLAHHYWHSDDDARKVHYLRRAADAAQAAYANAAAIDYLGRLLTLVEGAERVRCLISLARIHTLVGELDRAVEAATRARREADERNDSSSVAWTEVALGEVARRQGKFDEAGERLQFAERTFGALGEDAGVGRALHLLGTVASQTGRHDDAEHLYGRSAEIRERIGDRASLAAIWTNLGIVADQRGDFSASRDFNERALAIHQERGDRWGIANALNNIAVVDHQQGRLEDARKLGTEAVRLLAEIGDAQMLAIARHSLANVLRAMGELPGARSHLAASLDTYRRLDDRWGLAFILEDIGLFAAQSGESLIGLELVGSADRIRERDGLPRAPGHDRELQKELEPVRATLGGEAEAALARGRARELAAALDVAVRVLEQGDRFA